MPEIFSALGSTGNSRETGRTIWEGGEARSLRAWIHVPRAPEQFVTSPLCLVAACDGTHGLIEFLLSRQSFSAAFQVALRVADHTPTIVEYPETGIAA